MVQAMKIKFGQVEASKTFRQPPPQANNLGTERGNNNNNNNKRPINSTELFQIRPHYKYIIYFSPKSINSLKV